MPHEAKGTPLSVRMARGAEFPEGALEDRAGAAALDVRQSPAGEEIAGMLIADREGIAPDAVAGGELSLEVGGPEIVRGVGGRGDDARVLMRPSSSAALDQSLPGEQIPGGAHGRPRRLGDVGMAWREPVEQLAGAPIGMLPSRRREQVGHVSRDPVGTVVRGVAPVPQTAPSLLAVAVEPLVARLPADAVAGTQLRAGVQPATIVGNEPFALFHG